MAIKVLIMDVDGTLTDGKIYMGEAGEAMKAFHVKDGYAIHNMLPAAGITPVILTGRQSGIVKNRCQELGICELYQGSSDKSRTLKEVLEKLHCEFQNSAYIGDDLNDLECMETVRKHGGTVGCPADAVKEVVAIADFVSCRNGGDGAVREFIEWLVRGTGKG